MIPFTVRIKKRKCLLIKTKGTVWKNLIKIPFHSFAKSGTFRAGTKRIIKREKARLQIWNGNTTIRAGIFLAEENLFILIANAAGNNYNSVCIFKRNFNTVCKAASNLITFYDSVYDNLDCMFFLLIKFN